MVLFKIIHTFWGHVWLFWKSSGLGTRLCHPFSMLVYGGEQGLMVEFLFLYFSLQEVCVCGGGGRLIFQSFG